MLKYIFKFKRELISVFIASACVIMAQATVFTYNGIKYTVINEHTCRTRAGLGGGSGNEVSGALVIPETVYDEYNNSYRVTAIGDYSFKGNGITSIEFPESVTTIGSYAFSDCNKLKEVILPNGLTTTGKASFRDCTKLTSISIGNKTTTIDPLTFSGCTSLASLDIPNNVKKIASNAFQDCSNIQTLNIEDSETELTLGVDVFTNVKPSTAYLGRNVDSAIFKDNTNLSDITISDKVTSLLSSTFSGCTALRTVVIPSTITSIEAALFSGCTSLSSVSIPNTITTIGNYAFMECKRLSSITIPNAVTAIGAGAFYQCTNLAYVSIGNSVSMIDGSAFSGCTKLSDIIIPSSVKTINGSAFSGCIGITNLTIEDSSKTLTIGTDAFKNVMPVTVYLGRNISSKIFSKDIKLSTLIIGDMVTTIEDNAFDGCTKLRSVTFGSSLISIGGYAFYNCSLLTSISVPNAVTSIGLYAFDGCTGLKSFTLEDSSTGITIGASDHGDNDLWTTPTIETLYIGRNIVFAFSGAQFGPFDSNSYLNSVVIGTKVTNIPTNCFYNCPALSSLTIPNSVTSIGDSAFEGCSALTTLIIPKSVRTIGNKAFSGCTGLEMIASEPVTPPTIQSGTFPNYNVPLSAASYEYKTANYWSNFTYLAASYLPSGTTFKVDGLTYEIISINDLTCRLCSIDESVTGENVVIPETVEYKNRQFKPIETKGTLIKARSSIKELTIPTCTNDMSDCVVFKSSLKKITVKSSMLSDVLSLFSTIDELVIAPSVRVVNAQFISNNIRKITIENSATALNTNQFMCAETSDVYLGRNVSDGTFSGMNSLQTIKISDNVSAISASAFSGCSSITTVIIPNSVKSINKLAFDGCTGISELNMADGSQKLEVSTNAFSSVIPKKVYLGRQIDFATINYKKLNAVEFGENVTSIESGAFKDGAAIRIVVSRNATPPTTDDTFCNETYLDGVLYVPDASIEAYQAAAGWKNFWEVKPLSEYSGVDEIVVDNAVDAISVDGGAICVSGDVPVRIVAINGRTVYSGRGDARVNVTPGIYVVIVGNTAHKVAVR